MNELTTNEFIAKAKKVHDNKYDYSLVEYINSHIKVKIICPIHGVFEQQPNNHIQKQGCPKCGVIHRSEKQRSNTNDFINKSLKIHGNKYDYSLAEYKNCKTKIKIVCPDHGTFEQIPLHHLNGSGCYKCNGGYQLNTNDFINKYQNTW